MTGRLGRRNARSLLDFVGWGSAAKFSTSAPRRRSPAAVRRWAQYVFGLPCSRASVSDMALEQSAAPATTSDAGEVVSPGLSDDSRSSQVEVAQLRENV